MGFPVCRSQHLHVGDPRQAHPAPPLTRFGKGMKTLTPSTVQAQGHTKVNRDVFWEAGRLAFAPVN